MAAVLDEHPDPGVQDRVAQVSRYYSGVVAWPTTLDSATGEVQLRLGWVVDAVFIRAGLAAEVNHFLVRHLWRTPIIVAPGEPATWIFLTQPRTTMRVSTWDDLARLQVGWTRRGEQISLPALDSAGEGARWLQRPRPGEELAPWTVLVCAARSTSTRCGTW